MVFVFNSNSQGGMTKGTTPRPFKFVSVLGAQLAKEDWSESGRSATSRRTPTASVLKSGYTKMTKNWIFKHEES